MQVSISFNFIFRDLTYRIIARFRVQQRLYHPSVYYLPTDNKPHTHTEISGFPTYLIFLSIVDFCVSNTFFWNPRRTFVVLYDSESLCFISQLNIRFLLSHFALRRLARHGRDRVGLKLWVFQVKDVWEKNAGVKTVI